MTTAAEAKLNRAQAIAIGAKIYLGRPCKTCGTAEKQVNGSGCVSCNRRRVLEWERRNPEERRKRKTQYRQKASPEAIARRKAAAAAWRVRNKQRTRVSGRRHRGLPEPTRAEPEMCESCGTPVFLLWGSLHLDHCHITGAFRGWLCSQCNTGIGLLGDNLEGVSKAVKYLKRAESSDA